MHRKISVRIGRERAVIKVDENGLIPKLPGNYLLVSVQVAGDVFRELSLDVMSRGPVAASFPPAISLMPIAVCSAQVPHARQLACNRVVSSFEVAKAPC